MGIDDLIDFIEKKGAVAKKCNPIPMILDDYQQPVNPKKKNRRKKNKKKESMAAVEIGQQTTLSTEITDLKEDREERED